MTLSDEVLFSQWVDWAKSSFSQFVDYSPETRDLSVRRLDNGLVHLTVDPRGLGAALGHLESFGHDLRFVEDAAWHALAMYMSDAAEEAKGSITGAFSIADWTESSWARLHPATRITWSLKDPADPGELD